jgi:hypothetical protein
VQTADGDTIVHAIWNGATDVAWWDVLDASGSGDDGDASRAPDRDDRRRLASTWDGLDTAIRVAGLPKVVAVVAGDRTGHEIGQSAVTRAGQLVQSTP